MVNNYYQKHKDGLPKEACERFQNLSEEVKVKRRKKAREGYQNFTEEERVKRRQYYLEGKKKVPDYRQNYYLTHKKSVFFKDPRKIRLVSRISP